MLLDSLPRYPLATLPTPLDELPRLSNELGIRVLLKRDDLTGFALGGNKVRKLEYLLADALAKNSDMLITGGVGPQSNHARITAAAARRAGLDVILIFFGEAPVEVNGNLLLDQLLGAEIRYAGTQDRDETERLILSITNDLKAQGRRPYAIPVGGSTALGCVSYLAAVGELLEQLDALAMNPDYLFITTGSCGTHAGILAGVKYFRRALAVYGVTVSRDAAECLTRIHRLVNETATLLGAELVLNEDEIIVDGDYRGPGYARVTPEAVQAIRLVAQLEGIFLDPVYTGKTMAGLIDLTRRGKIAPGSTVMFWHTGGAPGIFGHAQDFQNE